MALLAFPLVFMFVLLPEMMSGEEGTRVAFKSGGLLFLLGTTVVLADAWRTSRRKTSE